MDMAHYLISHPEVKTWRYQNFIHPDEEIGRGVDKVDIKTGSHYGYTLTEGERGAFTDETFSADAAKLLSRRVSAHPGYNNKDKLVNALKVAGTF